MLDRLGVEGGPSRRVIGGGIALGLLVALPLVISGPGNDLDVGNVFRSGRAIARHGSYLPSRAPGSPVHEFVVGLLDLIGGPLLTNLASLLVAALLLVGLDRLLRHEGIRSGGRWAVVLVAVNPWFVIAATSTADYLFALAFIVAAALALRADRSLLAGALAALAMGCRIGSASLIAALMIAELTSHPESGESGRERRPQWRRSALAAIVAVAGTLVLFVPSFVQAKGVAFAKNDFSTSSLLVQFGRAGVKDLTLLGTLGSLVALVAIPALIVALRTWRTSWLVRFSFFGLVFSQVLFLRFPWKMPHLLPSLLCVAVLLAVALDRKPQLLVVLVGLQLLFAVVRVDVVQPD
ncbi:MAG: hypothetical protein ABIP03_03860, partial [Aquihabitans sp.]